MSKTTENIRDPGQWKVVPSWPEYAVTTDGRLFNLKWNRPVTTTPTGNGYVHVNIMRLEPSGERVRRTRHVHRLVAEAWIGICPPGMEINHKDGDGTNNRVDNLEYVTHAENVRHARNVLAGSRWTTCRRTAYRGERRSNARLTEKAVVSIRELYATEQYTHRVLATMFNVAPITISGITRGDSWTHVGGPRKRR